MDLADKPNVTFKFIVKMPSGSFLISISPSGSHKYITGPSLQIVYMGGHRLRYTPLVPYSPGSDTPPDIYLHLLVFLHGNWGLKNQNISLMQLK